MYPQPYPTGNSYPGVFPDPPVHIPKPPLPFSAVTYPKPGRLYTVRGVALSDAKRFSTNFFIGHKDGDCALHIDCRFDQNVVVRNTRRRGTWEIEERTNGVPVVLGEPFEIMILVERCRFMIAYNGRHHSEFVHRVPLSSIDTFTAEGHLHISEYIESNANPDPRVMQIPMPSPVTPRFVSGGRHVYDIPGGFYNGRIIHVGGLSLNGTFCINFLTSVDDADVGLHMSCRVAEGVVLNSRHQSAWQAEIRPTGMHIKKQQFFVLEITSNPSDYRILLNGITMGVFPFRHIRPESQSVLSIDGDVDLRYVCM